MDIRGGTFSEIELKEIPGTSTLTYSNTVQEYIVPQGVTRMKITAVGGSGAPAGESFGGYGANVSTIANVTSLSTLYVITGPSGIDKPSGDTSNAGVRGYFYESNIGFVYGGNGGGYSGVFNNSNLNITTALIIAGGGGGAGGITGYGAVANGGHGGVYGIGSGVNGGQPVSNITFSGRTDSLGNALTGANMVYFTGNVGNHKLNMSVVSNSTINLQSMIESVDSNANGASNIYLTSTSYVGNGGYSRTGTTTGTSGGGGGGGAGGDGNSAGSTNNGGNGASGRETTIYGNSLYLAGGGGGGGDSAGGIGGIGGGGNGVSSGNGASGTTNTGGGGGGSGDDGSVSAGGAGGSGIVILRYANGAITANGGTVANVTIGGTDYKVHTFTANGNFEISNANIGTLVDYVVVGGGGGGGGQFNGTLAGTIGGGGGGAGEFREGAFAIFDIQNYTVTIGEGGRGGGGATSNVELKNGGTGGNSSVVSADGLVSIVSTGGSGGGFYNIQGKEGSGSGGGGGGRQSTPPGRRYLTANVYVPASYSLLDFGDDLALPSNAFGNTNLTSTNVTMSMSTATITSRAANGAVIFTDNALANKRYGDGGNIRSITASKGVQSTSGITVVTDASNGSGTYAGWGSYVNGNGVLDGAGGGGGGSGYRSGGGGASGNVTQCGGGGGGASWSATGDIIWNGYNSANSNGYVKFDVVETRTTFSYTGLPQKFIVPTGAQALRITAVGAKGGNAVSSTARGGNGANVSTMVLVGGASPVLEGGVLTVVVGGSPGNSPFTLFGYAGDGGTQSNTSRSGSAGGGLSGVFTGGVPSIANAIIIAGGGGGAGTYNQFSNAGASGISYPGDASDGQASDGSWPGTGGKGGKTSTSTGGATGTVYDTQAPGAGPTAGTAIQAGRGGSGNRSADFGGGGGGGGAYAGGGGSGGGSASGGGGGGSSYGINGLFFGTVNSANGSHGSVIIDTIYGSNNTVTYNYTGNIQVYVPPAGATKVLVNAVAASGANGRLINETNALVCSGGGGANITAVVNVTPGTAYYVVVGGTSFNSNVAAYGFGGSGGFTYNAETESYNVGGAGGGLTGLFTTNTASYANALIVAGGGGGGGAARTSGGATNNGGSAASSGAGNGNNGSEDNASSFGRNAGAGGSITTQTAGAAGSVYDTNTTSPTAGSGVSGGNGGINNTALVNSGGGGGAGAFGGGGGAVGGDASGGGGAGATFFGNNTTSQQTYGALNYGHGYMTITVVG